MWSDGSPFLNGDLPEDFSGIYLKPLQNQAMVASSPNYILAGQRFSEAQTRRLFLENTQIFSPPD